MIALVLALAGGAHGMILVYHHFLQIGMSPLLPKRVSQETRCLVPAEPSLVQQGVFLIYRLKFVVPPPPVSFCKGPTTHATQGMGLGKIVSADERFWQGLFPPVMVGLVKRSIGRYLIEMIPQGSGIWKVTDVNDRMWRDAVMNVRCAMVDGHSPLSKEGAPQFFRDMVVRVLILQCQIKEVLAHDFHLVVSVDCRWRLVIF